MPTSDLASEPVFIVFGKLLNRLKDVRTLRYHRRLMECIRFVLESILDTEGFDLVVEFCRGQTGQWVVVLDVHLLRELAFDAILEVFDGRDFAFCFISHDGCS